MSLTLALIGAGSISKAHLAAVEALKGAIVVSAVIDPNAANRDAAVKRTGAKGFESADHFLMRNPRATAQAVLVCTPPSARVTIVGKALQAGLAVLSEKPIAAKLADAQALLGMSYQYRGAVASVGYCHRFVPAVIEMKKRADAGELGTLLRFENTFTSWNPSMEKHWMSDAASGGGAFVDTGSQSLDLFRFLIGDGTIASATFHEMWKGRGESSASVVIRAAKNARHNKAIGLIQSGWQEPARATISVTGTKASLFYDYGRASELTLAPIEGAPQKIAVDAHETRYERQLSAFAQLVEGASPDVRPASFEDGMQVARLVDEAARVRVII